MMRCKIKKTALEYAARTGLADYLRSIGEVPEAANARAAATVHSLVQWSPPQVLQVLTLAVQLFAK